ncbi:hypothetical protein THAOC_35641 [Thalassiosira oceanica]|uniref:Uncharacterized protein n=1 Tax=Thalassiosira oceanica TaxID=159749 RepID=K0R1E7_THAOC|nr:hypothetical protein THAOC_35641 [Thalassiosira oceanica]|eukprot:EJK45730.1 hypothetical protein THAOC_35641 [Thalassiosira oceanica]
MRVSSAVEPLELAPSASLARPACGGLFAYCGLRAAPAGGRGRAGCGVPVLETPVPSEVVALANGAGSDDGRGGDAWAFTSAGVAAIPLALLLIRLRRRGGESDSDGHPNETSAANHASTPPYFNSVDDNALIGGVPEGSNWDSDSRLWRGPHGNTITFYAFSPSVVEDIPKVDVYGALQFARTGKVRTIKPTGSRRMLWDQHPRSLAISITDRKADSMDSFETKPFSVLSLDKIVSIAAVRPRYQGVLEILSLGTCKQPGSTTGAADTADWTAADDSRRKGEGKGQRQGKGLKVTKEKASSQDCINEARYEHQEVVFCSPREAGQFQRIILGLRSVGRETLALYEALELSGNTNFVQRGVKLKDALNVCSFIPGVPRPTMLQKRPSLAEPMNEKSDIERIGFADFFLLLLPPLAERFCCRADIYALLDKTRRLCY